MNIYENATPRPWDVVPATWHHGPYLVSEFGNTIADLYTMTNPGEPSTAAGGRSEPVPFLAEMADPNAALIVHAVNNIEAAEARIKRLEASHAELVAALSECDGAIAEYERYWHGGETRGSYDGKPERRNLFTAKYRASTALSNAKALEVGNA